MNIEGLDDDDELDVPTQFTQTDHLGNLERRIYGHVLAAIDLDALSRLEQITTFLLMKEDSPLELTADLAIDLASQLIEGALRRVVDDPRRYLNSGPPHGVTPEEAAAVAFDESCPYCLADRESAAERKAAEANPREDEPCPCCDMLVDDWRKQHEEALAKAGLANLKCTAPSSAKRGRRIEVS